MSKEKTDDKNWTTYVLSQLNEDELYENKYPSVNGLRRILSCVLKCTIIEQKSDIFQICDIPTVKHTITVVFDDESERLLTVDGCADAFKIEGIYANYPIAVAETRAEGRALRRLLNIDVVVKEEIAGDDLQTEKIKETIQDIQITAINKQCNDLKIDVEKFLAKKKGVPIDLLSKTSRDDALELLEQLSEYINQESEIPKEILLCE